MLLLLVLLSSENNLFSSPGKVLRMGMQGVDGVVSQQGQTSGSEF